MHKLKTVQINHRAKELAYFNSHTMRRDNGCLEWTGAPVKFGYGRFCINGTIRLAHRASWELFVGPIPDDACVLHRCDNPRCVDHTHLFIGDRKDNARDMANKGRQWIQQRPEERSRVLSCPLENKTRGEQHGNTQLTNDKVLKIRERAEAGENAKALANDYGCSETAICYILSGRTWAHVGGPIRPSRQHTRTAPPKNLTEMAKGLAIDTAEIRKEIAAEARKKASPPLKAAQAGEPKPAKKPRAKKAAPAADDTPVVLAPAELPVTTHTDAPLAWLARPRMEKAEK